MMFTGENFNGLVHICLGLYFGLAIFFWLSQKFVFVWLFVIRWVIFVWFIFFVSSKFSLFAFPIARNCFFFFNHLVVYVMKNWLSCSRKIQNMESADLPTKRQSALETTSLKHEGEFENSINSDVKICCPCGSSLPTESMIQV